MNVIAALHPLSDTLDITRVVCTTKVGTQLLTSTLPNIKSLPFEKIDKAKKDPLLRLFLCKPTDFIQSSQQPCSALLKLNHKYDYEMKVAFRFC